MTYATKLITGLFTTCLLLGGGQIQAAQITHVFTGTVTNPGDAAPGVSAGDDFTATLSYSDSQAPVLTIINQARYAAYSFDLVTGSLSASEELGTTIAVFNDLGSVDNFSAQGVTLPGVASFNLGDSTGTAFSSTALPTSLSIADFDQHFVGVVLGINPLLGNIVDIQSTVVPELSCLGFDAPMGGAAVTVKKNRVLPLKAQLIDEFGMPIDGLGITASPVLTILFNDNINPAVDVTDDALSAGQGTDGNQFEFQGSEWQYNLKTKNYSASGTYTVLMQSGDTGEYVITSGCSAEFVIN